VRESDHGHGAKKKPPQRGRKKDPGKNGLVLGGGGGGGWGGRWVGAGVDRVDSSCRGGRGGDAAPDATQKGASIAQR